MKTFGLVVARLGVLAAIAAVVVLALSAGSAEADPEVKWERLPDLEPTGIDVDATMQTLADDFQCMQSGPITEIDIWGSWFHDEMPGGGPMNVVFELSIHSNAPGPPSHPGDLLWEYATQCGPEPVQSGAPEGWLWPPDGYTFPADNNVWLYHCTIPEGDRFYQQEGQIYWLDLHASPLEPGSFFFGWKTTPFPFHWQDDAVWRTDPTWTPLTYPQGHTWETETLDLAFRIWGDEMPPSAVGGIAELPDVSGSSGPNYVALGALAAAALAAFTAGGWYARRRWLG